MFSLGQTINIELDRNRFLKKEVRLFFCYKQMKLGITRHLHYPRKNTVTQKWKTYRLHLKPDTLSRVNSQTLMAANTLVP